MYHINLSLKLVSGMKLETALESRELEQAFVALGQKSASVARLVVVELLAAMARKGDGRSGKSRPKALFSRKGLGTPKHIRCPCYWVSAFGISAFGFRPNCSRRD